MGLDTDFPVAMTSLTQERTSRRNSGRIISITVRLDDPGAGDTNGDVSPRNCIIRRFSSTSTPTGAKRLSRNLSVCLIIFSSPSNLSPLLSSIFFVVPFLKKGSIIASGNGRTDVDKRENILYLLSTHVNSTDFPPMLSAGPRTRWPPGRSA